MSPNPVEEESSGWAMSKIIDNTPVYGMKNTYGVAAYEN